MRDIQRRRSVLSRLLRFLADILLLVALALLCGGVWLYHAARVSLPQIDGKMTVPGLLAPVKVVRDRHGVPHIIAANLSDLFFAQGYVTAQDRLWQMDMSRCAAAGELSEILSPRLFGKSVLLVDKRQRVLGIRAVAEKAAVRSKTRRNGFASHSSSAPISSRTCEIKITAEPDERLATLSQLSRQACDLGVVFKLIRPLIFPAPAATISA